MGDTVDSPSRPSIVDRFRCAAEDHEARWGRVMCCQCGRREATLWWCIWCDEKKPVPLCDGPTCNGHPMTLACCRVLKPWEPGISAERSR